VTDITGVIIAVVAAVVIVGNLAWELAKPIVERVRRPVWVKRGRR
jgi:hypothetical protein